MVDIQSISQKFSIEYTSIFGYLLGQGSQQLRFLVLL